MVMAPRAIRARHKLRISPRVHPAAVGIKAVRVVAKAEEAGAVNGRVATHGSAINVSGAATAVVLGNPTLPAATASVVLVVTAGAALARCIRRSRFLPPRLRFLAIYRIPRVSLIWLTSIP